MKLCSSKVKAKSHFYSRGKIISYTLIFTFLDGDWKTEAFPKFTSALNIFVNVILISYCCFQTL
jgi:hypothetical protein